MIATPHSDHSAAAAAAAGVRAGGRACDECLAYAWLISRLSGHLDQARGRIATVLALDAVRLLAAVGGSQRAALHSELSRFDAAAARDRAAAAGVELICRCDTAYPARLRELDGPPAVLHVAGGLDRFLEFVTGQPVAIVGARRATTYGFEVARSLGSDLGAAGIVVLSGMALGVDAAAHSGALAASAPTVAVMPAGAERAYPPAKRALHAQICAAGAAISELPPGAQVRRWTFPARNRIIAALAAMTVVVEAGARSGALITAACARTLGRPVGAVPGKVTSRLAEGPNELLADGACVVRGAQDVLDLLFGTNARRVPLPDRRWLPPELHALLSAIADGEETMAALARAGLPADRGLAALASLELEGYVRRDAGGRFSVRLCEPPR
jgi:DNA processing protein